MGWAVRAAGRGDDDERGWLAPAGTGIVIFLATPQWWFPHNEGRELGWGPIEHLVGDAYLIWGLVFLVLVGIRACPSRASADLWKADPLSTDR